MSILYRQSIKLLHQKLAVVGVDRPMKAPSMNLQKPYMGRIVYVVPQFWGGTSHSNLNRIYRLQKRAIKIILDYEHTDIASSKNELKILNIFERIFLRKAKFMYKISKSITPSYINEMFTLRTVNKTLLSLRSVNTSNFQIPRPQKEIFKQSSIYSEPVIWNNLPDWLKNSDSIDSFHNQCIKWMKCLTSCNL